MRQAEWDYQWRTLKDETCWLFQEWIYPNQLSDFQGKTVLDAGCGPGHHARLVAEAGATRVLGVDLNTASLARERTANLANVEIRKGDVATLDPGELFDIVYSVGVVHHTDDPAATMRNLARLVKPGGRLILWVYAWEGNALNRMGVEPLKRLLLRHLPRPALLGLATILTAVLYVPVRSIYRLPISWLPYHAYFGNFRRLDFSRNRLNVFDKLNAPVTHFIRCQEIRAWFEGFDDVHVSSYLGISWRGSGTRRA